MPEKKRQDTRLESEGAEFLVLGNLLIEGISCYKAYINFPGYDLVAVNPDRSKTAKIQVKSRWATDYDKGFPIKNFDCDFVVHVALNRGYRFKKKNKKDNTGVMDPVYYVFPVGIVRKAWKPNTTWKKVRITEISEIEQYKNNWSLISDFLNKG